MQVSVVLPMYNSKDTILDALESIRKQTAIDLIKEVIVVNDGSMDNSAEIVQKYIDDVEVPYDIFLFNQENKGVSVARNVGMDNAQGDWIALLDSDDEWLPNKMQRQAEIIKQNPQIDVLGAGASEGGLWILGKHIQTLHKVKLYETLIKGFSPTPSMIFRTLVNRDLGGFVTGKQYGEDQEYWHRMLGKYNYYYLPEKLVNCGHGKRGFGGNGLSGHMWPMFIGDIDNVWRLYKRKQISFVAMVFFGFFSILKFFRRLLILGFASFE